VLIIREMERGVAASTTWLTEFSTTGDTDDPIERTVDALQSRKLMSRRKAMESTAPFVTARTWLRLKAALGDAEAADGSELVELGACVSRYGGALMRTAVLGPPSADVQAMNDVVLRSLDAAIEAIKPGVTAGSVDQACRGVIEEAGFEAMFRKRTGYSVGVA